MSDQMCSAVPDAQQFLKNLQTPINSSFYAVPPDSATLMCTQPSTETEFEKKFKSITGMSVADSITLYEAQTGETLTAETVERMFTDANFAKEKLIESKNLHQIYRRILNSDVPATEQEAIDRGFTKLPFYKSIFHNPLYNPFQNSKYVDSLGHLEGVYDEEGNLVSSIDYIGTFNFFGPDKASEHWAADVDPYKKWGN